MAVLCDLQPSGVFSYFEELCAIPHGSRNTRAVSDYCVRFARRHDLPYTRDALGNVILSAPATAGYENAPPVMLQGHLDMVCEKEPDYDLDMQTDGLRLRTDGAWIWADGTTLGGDDGIAVAYMLAILAADDIPHPALEAVFTVDEEIGMLGAAGIDLSGARARRLLNIDSEEEGVLLTSCAGGLTAKCRIPVMWRDQRGLRVRIRLSGLCGGHSGTEIGKGRANANKLLARLLRELENETLYALCDLSGGLKDNAIPREAQAELVIGTDGMEALRVFLARREAAYRAEYGEAEPDLTLTAQPLADRSFEVLSGESQRAVLDVLAQIPDGVQRMSADIEGLVQTSLNCGVVSLDASALCMTCSVRSSVNAEKQALADKLRVMCAAHAGGCDITGEYPAWEYRRDSPLRDIMVAAFAEQYGHPPVIQAIHAGLECGLFAGKLPGLDCISFGPDIVDIHTTRERLSVASVQRTWEYLKRVLARCKSYKQ